VAIGFGVAVAASGLLNLLAVKMTGGVLMGLSEMVFFAAIGLLAGGAGAWLAVAYSKIKENRNRG
jgi:hypothetical protein